MKDAPTTFEKYGYTFTLHSKRGSVAIYEQRKGNTVRYEVMKLTKAKKDYEPYGVKAGDIMLPSTNQWGRAGWTYLTLDAAEQKAYELIRKEQ